jgi:hypothetical protein
MERSYARSTRYGFDRARWRGLCKVGIQEYLIYAIQNIETLIRHTKKPKKDSLRFSPSIAVLRTVKRTIGLSKGFIVLLYRQVWCF